MAYTILLIRLVGLTLTLLGIWQFITTKKYIKYMDKKGTNNAFSPIDMYSGIMLGILVFIFGLFITLGANGIYDIF